MTALLEPRTELATAEGEPIRFASWLARAGALAVDTLPGAAVIATMALLGLTTPQRSWLWWVFTGVAAVAFLATALNRWLLPVLTGWTLGRALFGTRIMTVSGSPAGASRLLLRDLAHLLDTASLLIGWFWPLLDRHNRTFADLLLRTEARAVAPVEGGRARRNAGIVFAVAALSCAAGCGLAYQVVYRYDHAVERTRNQISEQGPRIVEQMLSYDAASVQEAFAAAQQLATDSYRPQLTTQQDAVRKAGVTTNEYWAVSSAVLSAAPDRAAMLVALQGQRGADAKTLKFLTATVRVEFAKSDDGRWRVDSLIVLKRPLLGGQPAP